MEQIHGHYTEAEVEQYYHDLNEAQGKYQQKINNQINNSMIKTARVTRVNQVNEWNGGNYGTTFYCQVELDNGDKIEIGKKKPLQEGWEVTYEIVDTQQEWMKAKAAKLENFTPNNGGFTKTNDNTKAIKIGHAITNAVSLVCANGIGHFTSTKEAIKENAKMIYQISEELNNEL